MVKCKLRSNWVGASLYIRVKDNPKHNKCARCSRLELLSLGYVWWLEMDPDIYCQQLLVYALTCSSVVVHSIHCDAVHFHWDVFSICSLHSPLCMCVCALVLLITKSGIIMQCKADLACGFSLRKVITFFMLSISMKVIVGVKHSLLTWN